MDHDDVRFLCSDGAVLDAGRDDEHLAGFEHDVTVAELQRLAATEHPEEFVFAIVAVPGETALEATDLDALIVEPCDLGEAVARRRGGDRGGEVYLPHAHLVSVLRQN